MAIIWATLSNVELLVGGGGWGIVGSWGGLGPNILSLLVLIEISIRMKTRL